MTPAIVTALNAAVLISSSVFILLFWTARRLQHRRLPLPPAPRPSKLPFVGNALQMPTKQEWLKITEWARELGPVFSLSVLGKAIVFINTVDAARDLLADRWKNYSERPRVVMVHDLMGLDFSFALKNLSDPTYATFRRIFVREFSHHAMSIYEDVLAHNVHGCLLHLLRDPVNFETHLHNQVLVSVMAIAYGHHDTKTDDKHVQVAEKAMHALADVMRPGNLYLVELFPVLKHIPAWFPGATFRRVALRGRKLIEEMRFGTWEWSLQQYNEGKAQPSFFTRLMDAYHSQEITLDTVRDSCSVLHSVATDTTMSVLLTFLLAMLHAPEVQERAQKELDGVIGGSRLPTLSDRASLPYIGAVVKELLRWESGVPLGLPHVTKEDDVYNGMFIPSGTTVVPNQYGMTHDESIYPDPMLFRPERFLGEDKQRDPETIAFGFGARICPGRHLAQLILWLNVASILFCFDIKRPRDGDGNEFVPPRDYTSGLTSRPEIVQCRIEPRPGMSAIFHDTSEARQ
ncbi:unnamed protein product [Peniophora sp. CBMAI 1063]|nr:unnamed protein product [Peniophora sp. CBMAI 1063]